MLTSNSHNFLVIIFAKTYFQYIYIFFLGGSPDHDPDQERLIKLSNVSITLTFHLVIAKTLALILNLTLTVTLMFHNYIKS